MEFEFQKKQFAIVANPRMPRDATAQFSLVRIDLRQALSWSIVVL